MTLHAVTAAAELSWCKTPKIPVDLHEWRNFERSEFLSCCPKKLLMQMFDQKPILANICPIQRVQCAIAVKKMCVRAISCVSSITVLGESIQCAIAKQNCILVYPEPLQTRTKRAQKWRLDQWHFRPAWNSLNETVQECVYPVDPYEHNQIQIASWSQGNQIAKSQSIVIMSSFVKRNGTNSRKVRGNVYTDCTPDDLIFAHASICI